MKLGDCLLLRVTLVCLNCDLLVDASGGDLMTKHLTDKPNHICKVIQDRGMLWRFGLFLVFILIFSY